MCGGAGTTWQGLQATMGNMVKRDERLLLFCRFCATILLMKTTERTLQKYTTQDGKCPFEKWFNALRDKKTQAIIDARLIRLRLGNLGAYRELGDGVKELKINFGPGLRVYFAEASQVIVILLCAGDKGSQDRDIRKAKDYWADFLRRNKND